MRELTLNELEVVSGAGWVEDFWAAVGSAWDAMGCYMQSVAYVVTGYASDLWDGLVDAGTAIANVSNYLNGGGGTQVCTTENAYDQNGNLIWSQTICSTSL